VNTSATTAAPANARLLMRVALVIFVVTVAIGIVNGFHLFEMARQLLLTHLHAGTLGWITISVFAASYWLYGDALGNGGATRAIAIGMIIMVPLYVIGFASGNLPLRAITGTPVLLLIAAFAILLWMRIGAAGVTAPRLGMALALTVLVIGSTIGVGMQVQGATNSNFMPAGAIPGHAAAQVVGYLVLMALAILDWRLAGTDRLSWAGGIQMVILFVAGILVAIGALLNIPPLLGIFIPLEIIAMIIFLVRVGGRVVGARWLERGSNRHYAIAVPWLIANIINTIYFIQLGISQGFENVPPNLFIAADHAIFIGVFTNIIFGLVLDASADRADIAPWADHVVFWVMNIALTGFFITLLTNVQAGEKFFTPFQGTAILIGIVVYSMRLAGSAGASTSAPARAEAATG
jgi:hypothetical protein